MTEIVKPIEFTYAAGKVGGLGGVFIDGGLANFDAPAVYINFNSDGTGSTVLTAAGNISPFNWYTGGTPSGTTSFQLVVTNFWDSSFGGVIASHTVGTHNTTNSISFGLYVQGGLASPVNATLSCTLYITRGATTVSHVYELQVRTEV